MRDPVTPEVRRAVLLRDQSCLMWQFDPYHVCRSQWGEVHAPTALTMLTVEHVKDQPRMGKRAPSDPAHLVALCWGANVGVPNKDARAWFREYLAEAS